MGQSRKRIAGDGQPRHTVYYDDLAGRRRSAGTFAYKKQADRAWRHAEARVAKGRGANPARGRLSFARYVSEQ
jgi:hypothetical protein